jgi:hypothetical protein
MLSTLSRGMAKGMFVPTFGFLDFQLQKPVEKLKSKLLKK